MTRVVGFPKSVLESVFGFHQGVAVIQNTSRLDSTPCEIVTRPECETSDTHVHLATYVVLVDKTTKEVFYYQRGSKGTETRLRDYSIGVGGHVEEPVADKWSAMSAVVDTIAQELEEEVGLTLNALDKAKIMVKLHQGGANPAENTAAWLIHDQSNEVGKVHMGISLMLGVDKAMLTKFEDGTLVNTGWASTMGLIQQSMEPEGIKFESWSRLILTVADTYMFLGADKHVINIGE